jgi:hypothetical protein
MTTRCEPRMLTSHRKRHERCLSIQKSEVSEDRKGSEVDKRRGRHEMCVRYHIGGNGEGEKIIER